MEDRQKEGETARKRENEKRRDNHVFWQLGLALVVIRREGSERERGIRRNKASPRKRKAPLWEKKEEEITAVGK